MPAKVAPVYFKNLAKVLRQARQQRGLDVESASKQTHIKKRYLRAFEAGNYLKIDHNVFTLGQLRRYVEFLGLDSVRATATYLKDRGSITKASPRLKTHRLRSAIIGSRLLLGTLLVLLVLTVGGYIGWQAIQLASAPRLVLLNPSTDQQLRGNHLEVKGSVTPGSVVKVNSQEVYVDDRGNFSTSLPLAEGLQTIRVVAQNKIGRESQVERNVLVLPNS